MVLINLLSVSNKPDPVEFDRKAKKWVIDFTSIYQDKDCTPYIHCMAMHISEFLTVYGNIGIFNQQGLEKLNDFTTIFYQHVSNHKEQESLIQILNRIEELEADGYQRELREQNVLNAEKRATIRERAKI